MVSRSHRRPVAGSAMPPHRSTTVSPSTVTQTDAPTSPRSAKFRASSSRTSSKPGAHVPSISALVANAHPPVSVPASVSPSKLAGRSDDLVGEAGQLVADLGHGLGTHRDGEPVYALLGEPRGRLHRAGAAGGELDGVGIAAGITSQAADPLEHDG